MVSQVGSNELKKLLTRTQLNPRIKIKFQANPTHQFKKTNLKHWVGLMHTPKYFILTYEELTRETYYENITAIYFASSTNKKETVQAKIT